MYNLEPLIEGYNLFKNKNLINFLGTYTYLKNYFLRGYNLFYWL